MILYTGSVHDAHELIQFFRARAPELRTLRTLVITPRQTVVRDINGDEMQFPGLTYGNETLEELLRELGVIFSQQTLHNPQATPGGIKEFGLGARWTWGHDRVM